jgi:hypothetical protein
MDEVTAARIKRLEDERRELQEKVTLLLGALSALAGDPVRGPVPGDRVRSAPVLRVIRGRG